MNGGIALTPESHKRLGTAVRHHENTPLNELPRRRSKGRRGGIVGIRLGRTSSIVLKGTFATVDLLGGAKGSETVVDTQDNVYSRFGDIASGKDIMILDLPNGPEIIMKEC